MEGFSHRTQWWTEVKCVVWVIVNSVVAVVFSCIVLGLSTHLFPSCIVYSLFLLWLILTCNNILSGINHSQTTQTSMLQTLPYSSLKKRYMYIQVILDLDLFVILSVVVTSYL